MSKKKRKEKVDKTIHLNVQQSLFDDFEQIAIQKYKTVNGLLRDLMFAEVQKKYE